MATINNNFRQMQVKSASQLGYICYLTDNNNARIHSNNVYLKGSAIDKELRFIGSGGITFAIENGQYIKELVIASLVLNQTAIRVDIDQTATSDGLLTIKDVAVEL